MPSVQSKILHTKAGASTETLLVKFASAPTDAMLDGMVSEKVASFERLFPSVPGKEALEAEFGMDRWYIAHLSENADVESAAYSLAESRSIAAVEFDLQMKLATDGVTYPYEGPTTATKAAMSDLGFNDPLIAEQWNYYNLGDKAVATEAYAGGDINVKDTWHSLTAGDASIIVAVVDQGVDYSHPDLAAAMWVNKAEQAGQPDRKSVV